MHFFGDTMQDRKNSSTVKELLIMNLQAISFNNVSL